jgi:hypothetical protein
MSMLTTASEARVHRNSVLCGLGFHQWETATDGMDEQCFMCVRCGAVDHYDESNIVLHAMGSSAGRAAETGC